MLINPRTKKPFRLIREFLNLDAYDLGIILKGMYGNKIDSVFRFLDWFDKFKDTIELVNVSKELGIKVHS